MTSQPPDPQVVESVAAWLLESRATLTLQEQRTRLIAAGHDPRTIAAAEERLQRMSRPAPPQVAAAQPTWQAPAKKQSSDLMRLALFAVVAVVALYAYSQLGSPGSSGSSGGSSGGASRSSVTVSGTGIMNSEPITLSGDYLVRWSASNPSGRDCYHGTSLRTADGDRRAAELISTMIEGSGSGTVYVYGLSRSRYFVDASSGCDWSFTFVPN